MRKSKFRLIQYVYGNYGFISNVNIFGENV